MRALARARLAAGGAAAARASGDLRAARARLRRQRRRGARARGARRAGAALRVLVGRGDVGRQRGDREPLGGYRRRPRAFHARQPRHAFPSRARSADDDRDPARDLRRRPRFVVHDPLPADAADRRRGRGESHALRWRDGDGVEFFVYGRRGYGAGPCPRDFPRGRRARRPRPSRAATASIRDARSSRSRTRAPSTPACSTTT